MRLVSNPARALALFAWVVALAALPTPAGAFVVQGDIIADNMFMIFTANTETPGMVVNYTNNFRCFGPTPLTVTFAPTDRYLYLTCFSDAQVGQGLLHDLTVNGNPVFSGNANWKVAPGDTVPTMTALCNGPTPAQASAIGASMAARIPTMTFVTPTVGCQNTAMCYGIWGQFPAINFQARWTWFNSGSQVAPNAPFQPGFNHRELLVFRLDMLEFLATPAEPSSWGRVKNTYR